MQVNDLFCNPDLENDTYWTRYRSDGIMITTKTWQNLALIVPGIIRVGILDTGFCGDYTGRLSKHHRRLRVMFDSLSFSVVDCWRQKMSIWFGLDAMSSPDAEAVMTFISSHSIWILVSRS